MNFFEFKESLGRTKPPAELMPALVALWWVGKDNWEKAHKIVMDEGGKDSAWVHAYLHRVEGDLDNARYWYRRAQRPVSSKPFAAEWDAIAESLRKSSPDRVLSSPRLSGARLRAHQRVLICSGEATAAGLGPTIARARPGLVAALIFPFLPRSAEGRHRC
jgi:hypothetical protein